jgi:hypothetical protein
VSAQQLFGRRFELSVDAIKVSPALQVRFRGTKTYRPEPNKCEIKISNLNPEHRAALSASKTPLVRLAAGYGKSDDGLTQLFYGNAIFVKHEIIGNSGDIVTTVSTTDGGRNHQKARINVTFGPGTSTGTVLKRIVQALELDEGNASAIARELDGSTKANIYIEGTSISGSAANELSHVCRSCGYEWSIQDNTVQIRKFNEASNGFAVVLNPGSGLIGSPSISNKGIVSGRCLLFKAGAGLDLVPGRLIRVESEYVKGQYILARTDFDGDNYAENWYCDFEAVTSKAQLASVK